MNKKRQSWKTKKKIRSLAVGKRETFASFHSDGWKCDYSGGETKIKAKKRESETDIVMSQHRK